MSMRGRIQVGMLGFCAPTRGESVSRARRRKRLGTQLRAPKSYGGQSDVERDVAEVFKDSAALNWALRAIAHVARDHADNNTGR